MMRITIDDSEWKDVGRELRKWKNQDVPEFVRYRARIACADLIAFTPPRGDSPGSEGHKAQLKHGIDAVNRDISALWKSANSILTRAEAKSPRLGDALKKYIRTGDVHKFKKIITDLGFTGTDVVLSVDETSHDRRRSHRTGKALRTGRPTLVLRGNSLKALRRIKLSHIGRWKSGWLASAAVLQVSGRDIPAWVKTHGLNGAFDNRLGVPDRPSFTLINDVEGTQKDKEDEIVNAVLRINELKLLKEFEVLDRKFNQRVATGSHHH